MSKLSPFLSLVSKSPDVKEEVHSALVSQFVRAGGVVTLTEWTSMTGDDRAILVEEREEYMRDLVALLVGVDDMGDDDAAQMLANSVADRVIANE